MPCFLLLLLSSNRRSRVPKQSAVLKYQQRLYQLKRPVQKSTLVSGQAGFERDCKLSGAYKSGKSQRPVTCHNNLVPREHTGRTKPPGGWMALAASIELFAASPKSSFWNSDPLTSSTPTGALQHTAGWKSGRMCWAQMYDPSLPSNSLFKMKEWKLDFDS